jgi:hypothetical protein
MGEARSPCIRVAKVSPPLGTWERHMEMERSALQERAGSEMARALGQPGETWEELTHIALE